MARAVDGGSGNSTSLKNLVKKVASTGSTAARNQNTKNVAKSTARNVMRTGTAAANRVSRSSSRKGFSNSNAASRSNSRTVSGSYSRPATGSTRSGTIASTSPPPVVAPSRLTDAEILSGDTTYQGQNASYQKALQDYAAQYAAEKAKYMGEYDATKKQYGIDQAQGEQDLMNDFASRGLANSGLYADAFSDFTNNWNTKYADLDRARTAYMGDLDTAQQNFNTDQSEQLKSAQQQAIQRYLDKLRG